MSDEFYIGYLPDAPPDTARFVRRVTTGLVVIMLTVAGVLAAALPYLGNGSYEFGDTKEHRGTLRCDAGKDSRLLATDADYLLVGHGKHGAPVELCTATGAVVLVDGQRIARAGAEVLEVGSDFKRTSDAPAIAPADVPLGTVSLVGEIVDPKCYFGVMNPAEGRVHRACAVLCLRGGIPAVFVARDHTGAEAHLLVTGPKGEDITEALIPWVGESMQASGEVVRQGRWLVWRIDPAVIRRAAGG